MPSNPWFICTLWWAQCLIARAQGGEGLGEALKILEWVADHALPSGVLAEQVNPYTNEPLSVSPLTWSHAAFISAVLEYLENRQTLDGANGMTAADGEVSSQRHAARGHPSGRSRARQNLPTPHTESS